MRDVLGDFEYTYVDARAYVCSDDLDESPFDRLLSRDRGCSEHPINSHIRENVRASQDVTRTEGNAGTAVLVPECVVAHNSDDGVPVSMNKEGRTQGPGKPEVPWRLASR